MAASARAACSHQIGFVSTGHADGADPYFPETGTQARPPAADVPEASPALIMYTSGTTGRPKGAVLSHENLHCQSLTLIRAWRLFGDDEVNLCASPLFHIASQLVYATGRHQVSDVWINGVRKLAGRTLVDIDTDAVLAKTRAWRERIAAIDAG